MGIDGIVKLAQYTVSLLADPLLATWRAKREVEANRIRAHGQTEVMEMLAVGEAKAELAAKGVRDLAEGRQSFASLIEDEIEHRIESLFEKRLNNLAQIVGRAKHALPSGKVPDVEPDMAWTSSFSNLAQDISSEDMQELWARVLAGEVARPGRTSARTLTILRNLDKSTAQAFKRLCHLAVSVALPDGKFLDHRVISLSGSAASNSLSDFGLPFDVLNMLNEHELIIADYNSWWDFRPCIGVRTSKQRGWRVPLGFTYGGQLWGLIPDVERDESQQFKVSGVALTRAGRELSNVVEPEPVPQYDMALREFFRENGLKMERIQVRS